MTDIICHFLLLLCYMWGQLADRKWQLSCQINNDCMEVYKQSLSWWLIRKLSNDLLAFMFYAVRLCGQCRVWFLAWARDFSLLQNVQAGSGVHPDPYAMGTKNFSPLEAQWLGCEDDHTPHLVSRLRISGAIALLPLYTFMLWTGPAIPFCETVYKRTHCIVGKCFSCIFNVNSTAFVLEVPHQNMCAICINMKGNKVNGNMKGTML